MAPVVYRRADVIGGFKIGTGIGGCAALHLLGMRCHPLSRTFGPRWMICINTALGFRWLYPTRYWPELAIMLGAGCRSCAFPLAFVNLCFAFACPKAPAVCFRQGRMIASRSMKVLRLIELKLPKIRSPATQKRSWPHPSQKISKGRFWTRQLRTPITLAFLIAFFNQLSGINAILYFAPRIFELTGLAAKAALLQSVGIGVTNLIFTFVGLWLIDRLGRRILLFIGSFGYIGSRWG